MLCGIFVGGGSTRMGSPKALLRHEGVTLVDRAVALARSCNLEVALVGVRPEYADLPLPAIDDAPANIGPIGGLGGLFGYAHAHGCAWVIAIACDMPYVHQRLLRALITAPSAPIVAPRRDGKWEPLFARYDIARVAPILAARIQNEKHALQGLLDEAGATELTLNAEEAEALDDWDAPADMIR